MSKEIGKLIRNSALTVAVAFGARGSVHAQEIISPCEEDMASCAELFDSNPAWEGYSPYQEYLAACIAAGHDSGSCAELADSDPGVLDVPFGE